MGVSGPGYDDDDGDLIWFASIIFMRAMDMSPWYRPWNDIPWGDTKWPDIGQKADDEESA